MRTTKCNARPFNEMEQTIALIRRKYYNNKIEPRFWLIVKQDNQYFIYITILYIS